LSDWRRDYQARSPSYQAQRRAIARYAKEKNISIQRTFADRCFDLTEDPFARRALAELLMEVGTGKVCGIILAQGDHLASDPTARETILSHCCSLGATVIEAASGRDLTAELGVDQLDEREDVDKLKHRRSLTLLKRRVSRLTTKRKTGPRPFGSTAEESGTVALMLKLRRKLPRDLRRRGQEKRSFQAIADALNEQGLRNRGEKSWTASAVRGIIRRVKLKRPWWSLEKYRGPTP
jgi:hypothetical protein